MATKQCESVAALHGSIKELGPRDFSTENVKGDGRMKKVPSIRDTEPTIEHPTPQEG